MAGAVEPLLPAVGCAAAVAAPGQFRSARCCRCHSRPSLRTAASCATLALRSCSRAAMMPSFFASADNTLHFKGAPSLMSLFLTALQAPLQAAGVSAQISAAGTDARTLLAKLNSAAAAITAGHVGRPDDVIADVNGFGEALTSLPCAIAGNKPRCTNISLSQALRLQLVQGSQHKRSACGTARYYGKQCQVKHWKQHKPVCRALVAAAAAGNGSAAVASTVPAPGS